MKVKVNSEVIFLKCNTSSYFPKSKYTFKIKSAFNKSQTSFLKQ